MALNALNLRVAPIQMLRVFMRVRQYLCFVDLLMKWGIPIRCGSVFVSLRQLEVRILNLVITEVLTTGRRIHHGVPVCTSIRA